MARLKAPQRRDQLMQVATKLFAQSGFSATTTSAIAEAAGVTEPVLYRHFHSKHELFAAIMRSMSERTLADWRALAAGIQDPREQLRVIARSFPGHIRQLEDAYHVIHGALATVRDRRIVSVMREHYRELEEFLEAMLAEGQNLGVFRQNVNARVLAWQLIYEGIGYAMISLNLAPAQDFSVDEAIDAMLGGLIAHDRPLGRPQS